MKKKKIIIIILLLLILFGIYMLYNTFAINTIASNNTDNEYNIVLEDNNTITIPSNSNKTIYFHIKNTNKKAIKYGVGYNNTSTIEVKVYNDSIDKVSDTIDYGENKFIKLYLNNPTNTSSTVTLTSVLGYEYGGDLILPEDITLVKEVYAPPVKLAKYITKLYTNAEKVEVGSYPDTKVNYAPSVNLMNDRLGLTIESLDGGNIRYYGASPNNYIYFNCSDYSNQTSDTCELWRIIGVFDGKVKIMRNERLNSYFSNGFVWDTSDSTINDGGGVNEWSQAKLMKLLNPGYENESVGGSLYYNSKSGTCYYLDNNYASKCDFTTTGIKNVATKKKIKQSNWNTGGVKADLPEYIGLESVYKEERSTTVYIPGSLGSSCPKDCTDTITRTTSWTGLIALPYASDYGYAVDFNACMEALYKYDSTDCTSTNWMYSVLNSGTAWFLTTVSKYPGVALMVDENGKVQYNNSVSNMAGIFPTIFLSPDETILEGTTGTINNPYKLNP